jgi:hypothetical protein
MNLVVYLASATTAIYKKKDFRFHIPSGFDMGETISEMSFECWLSYHTLYLYGTFLPLQHLKI